MENEVIKADPALRNKVIGILVILTLGGIVALWVLVQWMNNLAVTEDPSAFIRLLKFLLPPLLVVPIAFALWMISFAKRTISQKTFPPLNTKVIKDTVRIYGKPARTKGYVLVCLALALIIASFLNGLFIFRVFDSLQ